MNDIRPGATQRLEDALRRIPDPVLEGAKVFTTLYEESARREAREAEARIAAGRPLGPLDGRIVSIKDLLDVAGEPTRAGSLTLRQQPPARADAVVVERLRAAGAVVIGKTQMTEFAFSALGTNPHDPVPGNPRDRARVPGGSSSGAVVSVVDGMAEIAIGSDTGGSIRIPAALCGAVGFKPTAGRVPTAGAFSLSTTLDTLGPISRSVADCTAAFAVLSGEATPPGTGAAGRITVARGRLFDGIEPEVAAAFEAGVQRLHRAGFTVEDGTLDPVLDRLTAIDVLGGFPSIELGATLRDLGVTELGAVDPKTLARIEAGAAVTGISYVRMRRRREELVQFFEAAMADGDAWLLPTTPVRAPPIAAVAGDAEFHRLNGLVLRNPRVANLLDAPSISLPAPSLPAPAAAGALPSGMMLIGRRNRDHQLLALAARVEEALRG